MAFGREALEASIKSLSAVACVVAFLVVPAGAGAFSGANGKIAFSACCANGNYEVYSMNPDGSGQTDLTNATGGDLEPAWSANGTKLAFSTDRNGSYDVYTMNADGSSQTDLTPGSAIDQSPTWSPDGSSIAFVTDRDLNYEIYSMNANGSGLIRLTSDSGRDLDPAWSPDGTKIAFASTRAGNYEIYTMNADGTGVTQLTNDPAGDREPAWSPDGTKIAFSSNRGGNEDVYVMSASGASPTNVSNNPAFDFQPAWSPDGNKIAFATFRASNYEVFTMNADGSGQTNATNGATNDQSPDWQPLARIIARKDAQPDDPQDFSFTAGGGLSPSGFMLDDDSNPTLSSTQSFDAVSPGSGYSLSETAQPGWDQTGASCDDGSPPSNIDVSVGETVTCTFTNQRQTGTVVVKKDAQPNDPQDFAFTVGGGLSPSSFSLDDDADPTLPNTKTFTGVPTGSGYSVSETPQAGWAQSGASCDDGSPPSNIDVGAGETVTCTFTNQKLGRIVVRKDAQPNDPQDFAFTAGGGLSPSSFSLDDDSDPTLSNTQSFDDVAPGSGYSVSETPQAGWAQSGASCDDGSPPSNIDVSAGETVTCTFTNQRQTGTIMVKKDAQPNDSQDFAFTAGGGLSPSSFSLDDDSDPTLSDTKTFTAVPTGSGYSISEASQAGWDQTAATCDDGSPPSNIDVSAGETVTCTFTNAMQPGQIVVKKDAVPDSSQDFAFTAGGGLSPSSFTLDDDSNPALSNTESFDSVPAGNGYSISETVPSGWTQRTAGCDDGSPPINIDVSPGETVTCTFVNLRYETPASAPLLGMPLVPVFKQCGTGGNPVDSAHSPPLSVGSCIPPATTTGAVAHIGSQSTAAAQLMVVPGDPGTPANEADISFQINATDIRSGSATGGDYDPHPGGPDVTYDARLRATDANSGATPKVAATTTDFLFQVPIDCTATAGPEGATCSVNTTANTVMPGAIGEGNYMVIQAFRLVLRDSGPDGIRGNSDDKLFAQQGLFLP